MGGFRRFGLFVFGVAGTLCLAALALPWMGPYQGQATSLLSNSYYYLAVQVALVITALGLLVVLLRALLTPRKRKTVVVGRSGNDRISVTTAAISSQATHVIEQGDRFVAEKVRVSAKKRGNVQVDVRVRPRHTVDVTTAGPALHDALETGLATICGDRVHRLNLEFVEAELPEPAQDVVVERIESASSLQIPEGVYEHAAQIAAGSEGSSDAELALDSLAPHAPEAEATDEPQDSMGEEA